MINPDVNIITIIILLVYFLVSIIKKFSFKISFFIGIAYLFIAAVFLMIDQKEVSMNLSLMAYFLLIIAFSLAIAEYIRHLYQEKTEKKQKITIKHNKNEKINLELSAGLVLIILLTVLTCIYTFGFFDSDGDGIIDHLDAFPNNPLESKDSDGDGVGDIEDAFPDNPNEQYDKDRDGFGDNQDEFPNNPREHTDTDKDGSGDNNDAFPYDPAASLDSDEDGYPDAWNEKWNQSNATTNLTIDTFPNNPLEHIDSDNDSIGDNSDGFPNDPSASLDSDEDGYPDRWNEGKNQSHSSTNLSIDAFPDDPNEQLDDDGDGIGNNADLYDYNPLKWRNQSAYPNELVLNETILVSEITNGYGITYDGTYYYILNHNETNKKETVFRYYNNFSYTGISWELTDYLDNPLGITHFDNYIYIIGKIHIEFQGLQEHILKFSRSGKYKQSTNINAYVENARAITSSNEHMYICNLQINETSSSGESIHIYNASTLTHIKSINLSHNPSDIIVHEQGEWYLINDQFKGTNQLYLYSINGTYQNWNISFNKKRIELVGDTLYALLGNKVYIYKLF